MPTLRPLRDYDEHDVINLFSWSGAVPAYKGTMVKIASPSGFVASDDEPVEMFGAVGNAYAKHGVPKVSHFCSSDHLY